MRYQIKFGATVMLLLFTSLSTVHAQRLYWFDGSPRFISEDGNVIVGISGRRAFRWTREGGMQNLGTLRGNYSQPTSVSRDGRVVVGYSDGHAFRWTSEGGMQDLGTLGGDSSEAVAVSADGSTVIGHSNGRAFRWTAETGMEDLGILETGNSTATGVSADGNVIVGISGRRAFRWTREGGMTELVPLRDPRSYHKELLVSADGNVIAGVVAIPRSHRPRTTAMREAPYYWTAQTGLVERGSSGYRFSARLLALSSQGNAMITYVQHSRNNAGTEYFQTIAPAYPISFLRWVSLQSISADGFTVVGDNYWFENKRRKSLSNHFHQIAPGSRSQNLSAVSGDGRYLVGWGYNAAEGRMMGFRFDRVREVPEPASFLILGCGLIGFVVRRGRNRGKRAEGSVIFH